MSPKLGIFPSTAYAVSGNIPNFGDIDYAIPSHLGVIYILSYDSDVTESNTQAISYECTGSNKLYPSGHGVTSAISY